MKSLLVLYLYYHNNTEKNAEMLAKAVTSDLLD